jgi:hypothetical protein
LRIGRQQGFLRAGKNARADAAGFLHRNLNFQFVSSFTPAGEAGLLFFRFASNTNVARPMKVP